MRIAVLTGGGDCPGLNAVIRAVVRRAQNHQFEVLGLRDGWKGLIEDRVFALTRENTAGILHRGGTILGTSRVNPFTLEGGLEKVMSNAAKHRIHAVVAIGGEGTLSAAARLHEHGLKVVGIPKTIDNDLNGTDYTFGFDTAVSIATEAIDRLHSTAESHKRVIVVEVMGRHVGWIATHAGIAGGADVILVPEEPADLAAVADQLKRRYAGGTSFSIVVVAEGTKIRASPDEPEHVVTSGALDEAGRVRLGGVGQFVASEIERRTGFETRVSVLGHIQRGGSPTAHDRVLASRFGVHACDMVARGEFGRMAALRGNEVTSVALADATRTLKRVPAEYFDVARVFFG
ncbi:MAG TPA: ATP-dependent 6-phosphofructokinase [Myxococcaceae bacterium]|nr:ATP-dependent 6-phosphofructokinase [Myxococcaceae bacterium]